jgi:nucleoside-diphosphate-sugar epimerase
MAGYRLAQYLAETDDWEVIGVARKPPPAGARFQFLPVDLIDIDDCRSKLSGLKRVTHLFYAARYDYSKKSDSSAIENNRSMLANTLESLERKAGSLKHVHLVHGTGYYGAPYSHNKTPNREDDPRSLIENFYYAQQDLIVDRQKGKRWAWSISRPQIISDYFRHISRSIPLGIAVYAAISKAIGIPLSFPGRPENYSALLQCTEASHLAKAAVWMATNEKCWNEAFNVANGDYFRWAHLWPKFAEFFGMSVGPVRYTPLSKVMPGKRQLWDSLARSHKLRKAPYDKLVLWPYVDYIFAPEYDRASALAPDYDRISDLTKLRKFGFHAVVDTEEMFLRFFKHFQRSRMVPT